MTLRMQYQTIPFGGFTRVDFSISKIDRVKLKISDSHAAVLMWRMWTPAHTTPIPRKAFVVFWDDAARDENGNLYTERRPIFEGFVEDVKPGDNGHTVEYAAQDPTRRAANEVTIMSTAWQVGTQSSGTEGDFPLPGIGAVPRQVFNATIDKDPDYAFSAADRLTAGQIISTLLTDQYQPLYWINAAPGDGTDYGNGTAFRLNENSGTGGGTELAGMSFEPQGKVVFESEGITSGIVRVMQQYAPAYRMLWWPGDRQWRFYDITQSPSVTLTLNDFSGDYRVMTFSIEPSMEQCSTAVEIRGPRTTRVAAPGAQGDVDAFTTLGSAPSLMPLGAGIILQTYATSGGERNAVSYTRWQIVDPTKRRGAKLLSRTVTVPMMSPAANESPDKFFGYQFIPVKSPTLQISFDFGATWMTLEGVFWDFQNGIVDMVNPVYAWYSRPPIFGSNQQFFPPNAVRLIYAYYVDPLIVRKPSSGFEGTAYSVAGLRAIRREYSEDLAVGYEYGTPVTTTQRRAAFEVLAQQLLDERKNIVWTGGCTLAGLQWDFRHLNKRINFAGVDGDGNTITTGWEEINAVLTDVEYDFEQQLTTLTFSSDQMALMRVDVDRMKEVLKIRALEQVQTYSVFIPVKPVIGATGQSYNQIMGGQITSNTVYVDPDTGEVQD